VRTATWRCACIKWGETPPAGTVLFDQQVLHVYGYRGELVERMTIEAAD
jgi:hypothetical protein